MSALVLPLLESAQHLLLVSLESLDEVPAPEDVRPGWIAMGSFLLLFAATILLWLSMRKQIGKINFDDGVDRSGSTAPGPDGSSGTGGPDGGPAGSNGSDGSAGSDGGTTSPDSASSGTPRA